MSDLVVYVPEFQNWRTGNRYISGAFWPAGLLKMADKDICFKSQGAWHLRLISGLSVHAHTDACTHTRTHTEHRLDVFF